MTEGGKGYTLHSAKHTCYLMFVLREERGPHSQFFSEPDLGSVFSAASGEA